MYRIMFEFSQKKHIKKETKQDVYKTSLEFNFIFVQNRVKMTIYLVKK